MIALPIACERQKPNSENALNDLIKALIMAESDDYSREFPVIKFSYTKTVPDHSYLDCNLFIETKYLRGDTTKMLLQSQLLKTLLNTETSTNFLFFMTLKGKLLMNKNSKTILRNILTAKF